MKKTLTIITFFLAFFSSFGQKNYEPQILILAPNETKYDKVFEKEISDYNIFIEKNNKSTPQEKKELNSKEFHRQPINIQRMMQSEVLFAKTLDIFNQVSFLSEQFLVYRFFDKFPNLLIQLSNLKTKGQIPDLKEMAEKEKFQYILNFPLIEFYKQNEISYARLAVQLYDYSSNSLLIDTSYIGDWYNPGFEFACNDSTLSCTINNSLSQALDNIIYYIVVNSPTLKKERKLQDERLNVLNKNYYKKSFDKSFISGIIPQNDGNINLNIIYQGLVNDDSTKFVGFFLEKVTAQNFKQLNGNEKDKNVNIITNKNIKDPGYLDSIPQTYAYIVKAVKYRNKWYYEKSNVTYFEAEDNEDGRLQFFNNLAGWNLFKDNSTEYNPDFWETNLFAKIKDLRKDPDWNKYGKTIWKSEEEENRNYIGMYEFVANQLKVLKSNQPKRITVN